MRDVRNCFLIFRRLLSLLSLLKSLFVQVQVTIYVGGSMEASSMFIFMSNFVHACDGSSFPFWVSDF